MKTDLIQGIILPETTDQSGFVSQKLKILTKRLKTVTKSMTERQSGNKSTDFSPKISRRHVDREVEDLISRLRIRDY